ncbi:ABC transporter permease [Tsukamurella sp. 8F]|uniref:ABC transporter permease n=1 Tax=unclassified Tsukamurella TaxID=2633480 RepID=UPI0023B8C495|nr:MULTISPECIES: ABC transporter permease [unclassified Tsukamurella]MDF0531942.1 ABC transporter permease [Tsukamurella sp. 8J]MDF0588007.1 ABC transporter permease [Tsukamurella sp. 8F]
MGAVVLTQPVDAVTLSPTVARVARLTRRRLAFALPLVVAISAVTFALAWASPFDPVDGYLGDRGDGYTDVQREELRTRLGLDEGWASAWWHWLGGLLHGDLGFSRAYHEPVTQVLSERFGWSMLLGVAGGGVAIVVALVLGIAAGIDRGGPVDRAIGAVAVLLQSLPPFVLPLGSILLISTVGLTLPVSGVSEPGADPTVASAAGHLVVPALALGLSQTPWLIQGLRESMVRAASTDAVAGARARGLPRRAIEFGHVLPAAIAPFLALAGGRMPELLVGATVVETVFAWPGLGEATVESARALDFPMLAVIAVSSTAVVLMGNLAADAAAVAIDPRIADDG